MRLRDIAGSGDLSTANTEDGSSPRNELVAQSWLDLPHKIEFNQSFRYVSALPGVTMNGTFVHGYETADARISWHVLPQAEFAVTGQNLLQARHVEYGGDPNAFVAIKRSVYASITWRK